MTGRVSGAALAVLLAVTSTWVVAGCASSTPKKNPDYADRVRARLEVAGLLEVQQLRFNPTPCNCPPFEILLDGRWHRVAFGASEEAPLMVALQEATKAADAQTRGYALRGSLSGTLETCAKGAIFVTFTPTIWDDAPPDAATDSPPPEP